MAYAIKPRIDLIVVGAVLAAIAAGFFLFLILWLFSVDATDWARLVERILSPGAISFWILAAGATWIGYLALRHLTRETYGISLGADGSMEFLRAIGKESITICEVLGVDASIPSRKIRLTLRGRTIWVDYFDGASSFVERLVQLNPEIEVGGQWDHISDTHSRSHAALTEGEQCWSCDRRPANPASAATVYMTRKALPTGDQTAEAVVPRCSACESIDRMRTWLSLGGFVLGIAIAFPLAMTWSSLGLVTWLVSPVVLGVLCPTLLPMLWPEVRTLRLIRNAPSVARMEAQGWKVASVKGEATISIEGGD